ncbi:glycosyltransferase family 2 protein [Owenweeksia hongkongensis]|uniref:glycosyltransferase family 2 protein n=1 Tax=Owenweeksia hongkongensis TaxID=253245 RepID=UPI003A8FD4E0
MSVTFSIIIPVYNAAKTLADTLESIAAQTYPHFEVICVNDGSTDRSAEILQKWNKANPKIDFTLINQKNGGLGNARNRAIRASKNPWVAFIDADDIWLPNKLAEISSNLTKNQADVIYHSFTTFGGSRDRNRDIFPIHSIEDLLTKGNPLMPSAVVIRTGLLLEFPFSEDPTVHGAEDFDLWLRLLQANKKFKHLDKPLTKYRETGGMSTRILEHLKHVVNVISKYHELAWFDDSIYQKAIARKNWEVGRFYHKNGKFEEAKKFYNKAGLLTQNQKLIQLLAILKISR